MRAEGWYDFIEFPIGFEKIAQPQPSFNCKQVVGVRRFELFDGIFHLSCLDVTQKGVLPKERPEKAPVDSKVVLPKAP
jgi:hypothetical protein